MTLDIELHCDYTLDIELYGIEHDMVDPYFLKYCLENGDKINIINNAHYSNSYCEQYLEYLLEVFDKDFLKANVTFEGFESDLLN